MKICWDNLEKLEYRKDRGEWKKKTKDGYAYYEYCEKCLHCSEPFLALKGSKGSFCSYYCSTRKFSENHKRKISENHADVSGKNNPGYKGGPVKIVCKYCGTVKEFPRTLKDQVFCDQNCFNKWLSKNGTGDKNPNWKGGISSADHLIRSSIKYKEWRVSVFERDNYTCQKCGKKGSETDGYLHAHHIKAFAKYPEFRFDINNGITYCKKCHYKIHTLFNKNKI